MSSIAKHENRFRSNPMTQKEKIAKAQKQSENQRPSVKITLKKEPWISQDQTTNQSPS